MYVGSGVLAWHTGSPGLNPQCHINWEWKGTSVSPTLERESQKDQKSNTTSNRKKKKNKASR